MTTITNMKLLIDIQLYLIIKAENVRLVAR